ncbi:hypothetical protein TVAG_125420 [Trichomonas vaginalis G3]|uniref:Uncharacterized protein n=1 Tax=Trichomonas vaginalis (strain ATCC PRA-98 / G3) TaxID=412133 RepID=A2F9L7_TRIV3|nr:hypothetical protein TVAGG3_0941630 [Trichomonas vaginalis G3]EAX98398.1 hypothetical protein TVAG_125420 [Trichomonas vaginalis G3]KAI5486583.1 hypothetical protein TVAGG3_0941630 [Trichomonas vaginalis G3]|eukprot:XP_001311328.1 hypothetical protein [Trichomonas vaginalis G3]
MLSILVSSIYSFENIYNTGSYQYTLNEGFLEANFKLPQINESKYFMIISNPIDDIKINSIFLQSNIFTISNQTLIISSKTVSDLYFDIVQIQDSCSTLEFLINPENNTELKYKANLKSSETYCLLASGANSFDITVSNSNGNTNQFSYSNTTNNSDVVVNAGESITLSLQKALLLKYTVNTISDDNEVSFKFTYSSLNATSFAPILVYNESSSSYFATNTTVISSSPSYAVLKYAMHDDYSESFTANHSVEANTYVVFSKWDSSINGVAHVGETKLDILGDTNIVAVWFEKPGVLRLTSDENSHGKGRFFAYSMGECDYVLTASGEEVTRYSSSNENTVFALFMLSWQAR